MNKLMIYLWLPILLMARLFKKIFLSCTFLTPIYIIFCFVSVYIIGNFIPEKVVDDETFYKSGDVFIGAILVIIMMGVPGYMFFNFLLESNNEEPQFTHKAIKYLKDVNRQTHNFWEDKKHLKS